MRLMLCEQCEKSEATIHLTQVVDGEVKKVHLCESCAAKSGFDLQGGMSITDILLSIGGQAPSSEPTPEAERSCPACHMQRSDFKKSGQFGCPACYEAFAEDLKPLLKAIHHAETHTGKVPSREGVRVRMTAQIAALQRDLGEAVADERYEEAAQIRDRIRECREQMGSDASVEDSP
jgi:protein arginine kinase activator